MAVEKTHSPENGRKNFALGSPTNDFLGFPRHFLSPKFRLFWRKRSFSTATPDNNSYRLNESGHLRPLRPVGRDREEDAVMLPPARVDEHLAIASVLAFGRPVLTYALLE